MSAFSSGIDGSSTHCTHPSGAPAALAASYIADAASQHTDLARGWGQTTTTLRVIRLRSTLKKTVATGFVDGVRASTTPAGRGISTILAASSTRTET